MSSPPKSPYQIFIDENNQILDSLNRHTNDAEDKDDDKMFKNIKNGNKDKENDDEEFYESLEQSLEAIGVQIRSETIPNLKQNNSDIKNNQNSSKKSDTEEPKSQIQQMNQSSSASFPNKKIISNTKNSTNSVRSDSKNISNRERNSSFSTQSLKESEMSSEKIGDTPNSGSEKALNEDVLLLFQSEKSNKSNKAEELTKTDQTTPVSIKKSNSNNNRSYSESQKRPHNETNRQNSTNKSKSQQEKTFSSQKTRINETYIDYIDMKKRHIHEKWQREDLEQRKKAEEEELDKFLIKKPNWKKYNLVQNGIATRNSKQENVPNHTIPSKSGNETEEENYCRIIEMPPNPSKNLTALLEIPVVERLLTPKKNLSSINSKNINSVKPKKNRTIYDDSEFFTRQAQYENEKRRTSIKNYRRTTSSATLSPKKGEAKIFAKLYDQSVVDRYEDSSSGEINSINDNNNKNTSVNNNNKNNDNNNDNNIYNNDNNNYSNNNNNISVKISNNGAKWTNNSKFWEPKKPQSPPQRPNSNRFRNERFSPISQKIAQKETRSFNERTAIEFDDVMEQYRASKMEKKRRELYNEQYLE